MKNEKFCFSKGTGLIALVGVLLVGFVLANQMVTNTKTSINSRAGGGTGTSSVSIPAAGTLVLSELKTRASQVLAVPGIEAAQTNATGAFTAVTSQLNASSTAIDTLINSQISTSAKEAQSALKKEIADVTAKKAALDGATVAKKSAQGDVDSLGITENTYKLNLSKAQSDLENALKALTDSKNEYITALKVMAGSKRMPKVIEWIDKINAVSKDDEKGYLRVYNDISKDEPGVFTQIGLKLSRPVQSAWVNFSEAINSTITSREGLAKIQNVGSKFQSLVDAKSAEKKADDEYTTVSKAVTAAQNQVIVYESMVTEASNVKNKITALSSLVLETTVLPAGISGVVIPVELYGVDGTQFQFIQQEIDKVNISITNANAAYTAFDSAISGVTIPANTTSGGVTPGVTIPANTTSGGVTPGVLTCKQQGGDYYKDIDCKTLQDRMKTLFKDAVAPKDQKYWPNRVCCIGVKRTL